MNCPNEPRCLAVYGDGKIGLYDWRCALPQSHTGPCQPAAVEPTTSEAAARLATHLGPPSPSRKVSDGAVASGAADEPTPLQRATAAVLVEAGMTLADEPKAAICGAPTTYIPGEWCELPEGHDGAHGRGSRVPAADEPKGERPAVAYVPATRWSGR